MSLAAEETRQNQPANGAVAVLGGSGFIGTRLAGELLAKGIPVTIGDLGRSEAYPELWKPCDVRNADTLPGVLAGASAVINLAAEHRDDVQPVTRYHETNVKGAEQVCSAARAAGVQKIVFTSSVAVYGFQPEAVGEDGPFEPFNEYGKTKLEAEGVYRAWAEEDPRRSLVIVRPTVVFGEGNRGNVYNLLHQMASGKFFMVGSGQNVKSMAYVGNVTAFLTYTLSLGPGLEIFNYVDGPDMSTNELVEFISRSLGKSGKVARIPKPAAMLGGHTLDVLARLSGRTFPISAIRIRKFCETTRFRADRIRQRTSFVAPFSLREGLERTIRFEFAKHAGQRG
ncbi:MAG: NAD(P)-dependent oxidoreductase [Acidobacteriaceae bacterium]